MNPYSVPTVELYDDKYVAYNADTVTDVSVEDARKFAKLHWNVVDKRSLAAKIKAVEPEIVAELKRICGDDRVNAVRLAQGAVKAGGSSSFRNLCNRYPRYQVEYATVVNRWFGVEFCTFGADGAVFHQYHLVLHGLARAWGDTEEANPAAPPSRPLRPQPAGVRLSAPRAMVAWCTATPLPFVPSSVIGPQPGVLAEEV